MANPLYQALQKVELFSGLPEDDLELIAAGIKRRQMGRGSVVFHQGDDSHAMYLVDAGKVKVYLSDDAGKETILGLLGSGDYFGELSLLDDAPRMATVEVLEDCGLLQLSQQHLLDCIRQSPELALNMLASMVKRLRTTSQTVGSLASLDVYGRVANVLMKYSHLGDDGVRRTDPLTHQDIANMVGSSREMVSKILKELRVGGYISIEKKRILIRERLPARW
jgi:CRP/FNR family cyclic AMP-dependent transcriptional regulator